MTEQEYIDTADLARLRAVDLILNDCLCLSAPNKTRMQSIRANIRLMTDDLFEAVPELEVENDYSCSK